jgi:hypothetical protein
LSRSQHQPWRRSDAWSLGLLAASFLASRLIWLAANPSSTGYWEESYRWLVAHDLLHAPQLPFLEYQADHYQGGSLVMAVLVVPCFLLFGETTLAFKIPALLISLGTLAMLYVIGRSFFDRATALLACISFLAGPPLVAYMGLVVMGSHGESVLFSLVQVFILLSLLEERWTGPWGWALLGVVSGLGLWFCYTTAFSLAACGIAWVVFRGLPRPRDLLAAVGGGLAGLVPWLVYNLRYDFRGIERLREVFGYGNPIDPWPTEGALRKLGSLLTHDLPEAAIEPFAGTLPRPVAIALMIAFAAPVCALLSLAAARMIRIAWGALRAGRDDAALREWRSCRAEGVFLSYLAVFVVVFAASEFALEPMRRPHGYRLLMPPLVFAALPLAAAALRAIGRRGFARGLALAGCAAWLLASGIGTVALMRRTPDPNQTLSADRGYPVLGLLLHRKYEDELPRAFAVAASITDPLARAQAWRGIGWGMEYRFEKDGTLDDFRAEIDETPEASRGQLLIGSHYFTRVNINQLSEWVSLPGAAGERYRRTLERLRLLDGFLVDERTRYPVPGEGG